MWELIDYSFGGLGMLLGRLGGVGVEANQ